MLEKVSQKTSQAAARKGNCKGRNQLEAAYLITRHYTPFLSLQVGSTPGQHSQGPWGSVYDRQQQTSTIQAMFW